MNILFPLTPASTTPATTAPASSGLRFTLPLGGGTGTAGAIAAPSGAAGARTLAVAAAATLDDEADALKLARFARTKPDKSLALEFDVPRIKAVLAAVQAAQEDTTLKFEPTAEEQAAAAAVGVNVRLVSAAAAAIAANPGAGADARRWAIRLLDPGVLDRAARASGRAEAQDAAGVVGDAGVQKQLKVLRDALEEARKVNDEQSKALDVLKQETNDRFKLLEAGGSRRTGGGG